MRPRLATIWLAMALISCSDAVAPFVPVATSISVSVTSLGFSSLGETQELAASVRDQNGATIDGATLVWSSSAASVASVSPGGLVTAVSNGTASLTVRSGEAEAVVPVSVAQSVASLTLGTDSIVFPDPGASATLVADVRDSLGAIVDSPPVVWTSSDFAVATVDSAGAVVSVETGAAIITATVAGHVDSVAVRVEPELLLSAVGTFPLTGEVATQVPISALVADVAGPAYEGATVTWSVGAASGSIVSTDQTESDGSGFTGAVWRFDTLAGTQRAFASIETRGQTLIVEFLASIGPGVAATATLVADTVLLSAQGETVFLAPSYVDAYGNPTTGTGIAWSTSDPGVASVSTDGLVTGVGEGSAWIVGSVGSTADSIGVTLTRRGAITVTFDDGWRSVYENAWPVFQEFSMAANVGVYTEAVGFPAYMTEAHLDELHQAGWSMASHTVSHDTLTLLTAGELDFELRASQQWLVDRGYQGSNVLVVPYHLFDEPERIAASAYYTAARGASANEFTPDSLVSWMPNNPYLLRGIDAESLPFTTVAGRDRLRTLLQRTADEGAFLDLYFHKMLPENVDALRATLEVLAEFEDRVLPYHELYPLWARPVF